MNTRSVVTGKDIIYLGRTLGNVQVERIEVKGDPRSWVDTAMKSHPKDQLGRLIAGLAKDEGVRHPFTAGSKMGRKAFWRNALGYFNNLVK